MSESYRDISEATAKNLQWLTEIEANNECCSIKDLDITGNDLLNAGFSGEKIGKALDKAVDAVIEGKIQNKKADLLTYLL